MAIGFMPQFGKITEILPGVFFFSILRNNKRSLHIITKKFHTCSIVRNLRD